MINTQKLEIELKHAIDTYYDLTAPSAITDEEFDLKRKTLKNAYGDKVPNTSILNDVGSTVIDGIPHSHIVPMLSLDNIFSSAEMDKWLSAKLKKGVSEFTIEPKWDGLALSLEYTDGKLTIAATRGDGTVGNQVTTYARSVKNVRKKLNSPRTVIVRGEVVVGDKEFAIVNELRLASHGEAYCNRRNAAAGMLKTELSKYLTFIPYQIVGGALSEVEELGFTTMEPPRDLDGVVPNDLFRYYRHILGVDIDGLVIKATNEEDRTKLGLGNQWPNWAIAYKFPPEAKVTKLLDVRYQVGKTGTITPVADIEPVVVSGVTVTSVTLHNKDELIRLGLHTDCDVTVCRAGEVIPKILMATKTSDTSEPVTYPAECPCCGTRIVTRIGVDGNDLVGEICPASYKCSAQLKELLAFTTGRAVLNIMDLGDKAISALVDSHAVESIIDLNRLSKSALAEAGKIGEVVAAKILKEVHLKFTNVPMYKYIRCLGIPYLGNRACKDLANILVDKEALRILLDPEAAMANSGIKAIFSASGVSDYILNTVNPKQLEYTKLVLDSDDITVAEQPALGLRPLVGLAICITGSFERVNRKGAIERLEELGAKVVSSVSSKTSYLIAGTNAGSKLKKAIKLEIPVHDEEFLEDLIKEM